MARITASVLLLSLTAPALAQPPEEPIDGKIVIRMTLSPAPIQKMQSRFLLTPQYAESEHGNRVLGFMKSYMEQNNFFSREPVMQRNKWMEMTLEELPVKEIQQQGIHYGRPLKDVDEAARLRTSDWQEWHNLRRDGFNLLLPEVQKMRELAGLLKLRLRVEIKTGDFDKAIFTCRSLNGLATSFNTHPTMIGAVVGLAIQLSGVGTLEEFIVQPKAPNLFWSLQDLSAHTVDTRLSLQGERLLLHPYVEKFLKATGPIEDAEFGRFLKEIEPMTRQEHVGVMTPGVRYAIRAKQEQTVAEARALLIELGGKPEHIKAYTPLQAIVTADIRMYEHYLDELAKVMTLPHPQAVQAIKQVNAELQKKHEQLVLAPLVLPTALNFRAAQTRLKQHIAALQVIEGVRWYAHEHKKWPAKLDDIALPLPNDPATDKPFLFSLDGDTARLQCSKYNDMNPIRVFEMQLRK